MLPAWRSPALTRIVALLLTLAIAAGLTSCTGDDPPRPDGAPQTATTLGDTIDRDQLIALLAQAGISTYDDAADAVPVVEPDTAGRMSLTGWQVETMARELNAGRGYLGRDLDALTGTSPASASGSGADSSGGSLTPSDVAPLSVVLAAWISAAETPAAEAARELMGERDWANDALDLVYPNAVIALFTQDISADPAATGQPTDPTASPAVFTREGRTSTAMLPARAGICSDLVTFLSGSLDSIVQSLQVQVAEEGALSILASIWNTVVSIAASAAKIAIGAFTSALLAPVTKAITVVAVLSSAASLLNPWTLKTTVSPSDSLGPGTDAVVTTTVDTAVDFEWPADLKDCASTIGGVELPDPGSAKGSEVTWTYQDPDLTTTLGEQDEKVGEDGAARLRFTTLPQADQDGIPVTHAVIVKVDLKRTQIDKLTELVDRIVLGALPGPARAIVDTLLGPLRSKAQAKLAELLSVAGPTTDIQTIRFEPNPDPVVEVPPVEEEDCATAAPSVIPDGVWKGPIDLKVTGKGLTGQAFSGGRGTMTLTVKNDKVISGRWNVDWLSTGLSSEGGIQVALRLRGNVNGGVKGSAAKPLLTGSWSLTGRAVVSVGGAVLPLGFDGKASETMQVETSSCDQVSGTFVPSFNDNAGGGTSFSGTARWSGARVG
ncbi:hypothetical protein [Nocardioides psychrotolerans]|uniref:hypothetical protein n=1 Tax=Nocardioides psychrotolerans TaxID=1005945 RepID=UPI003137C6B1